MHGLLTAVYQSGNNIRSA